MFIVFYYPLLCVFIVHLFCEVSPNQMFPNGTVKFELQLELECLIHRTSLWETLVGNETQEIVLAFLL